MAQDEKVPKSRQQRFADVMSGEARGVWPGLLRAGACVGSGLYRGAVALRNRAYTSGLLRRRRLDRPVISIGNISVGGTGKTVLAAEVARWALEAGHRPAVLIRGYKGEKTPVGSDEAALLRQLLGESPVEANPDRAAAGRRLLAGENPPDLFILDDGFQHRRLVRDLDVVTIDATMDLAGPLARLLPRGLLREPVGALSRADCVVITRADQTPPDALARLTRQVRSANPDVPILRCRHAPAGLLRGSQLRPVGELEGISFLAFCGIGNPQAFRRTLTELPGECIDFVAFDDHHVYTRVELDDLARRALAGGAAALLTTSKDYVKLTEAPTSPPFWAVQVQIEWMDDPDSSGRPLRDAVRDLLEGNST